MSNQALLYTLDDPQPKLSGRDDRVSRREWVASYHLPVLWLALFDEANLRICDRDGEGDVWPYCVCDTEDALARLQARRPGLVAAFGRRVGWLIHSLAEDLAATGQRFVVLDTWDVGSMVANGPAWADELRAMLRWAGQETSESYRKHFPLPPNADGEALDVFLAGPDYEGAGQGDPVEAPVAPVQRPAGRLMVRSMWGQRAIGAIVCAVCTALIAWNWMHPALQAQELRAGLFLLPAFAVMGLSLVLFPMDVERLEREFGTDRITRWSQLPRVWRVLLFVMLAAAVANVYLATGKLV
jgi:hypothetical protein